jgi:quercetin dioxygenase-like cupin family protein
MTLGISDAGMLICIYTICKHYAALSTSMNIHTVSHSHPHRGFQTVTYVMEGSMIHRDNMGVKQTYSSGRYIHIYSRTCAIA